MKPSERMLPLCLIMVSLCLVSLLEVGATVSCFAQEAYNVWLQRHKVILCRTQVFPVKCRIYGLVLSICRKSNCGNSAHAEAMEVHLHVFLRKTTVSLMTLKETVEFTTNKKTHQKKKYPQNPHTSNSDSGLVSFLLDFTTKKFLVCYNLSFF